VSGRRKSCRQPESEPCVAGKRGPCSLCTDLSKASARMKALHADPEFAAKRDALASARMKALNAAPEFAAKRDALASARMKALHADPEFAAKASARMKALNADPEFAAKRDALASARMKALHADPEFAAKASARMKALNADPEFRARNVAAIRQAICVRWTPEMDQALIDLWEAGTGLIICAEKIGVAPNTCRARVDHLGLAPHKRGRRSAAA
jgi:hypothetical protein